MKRLFLLPLSAIWLLTSGITFAIVDTNGNTVSDLWEKQYNNGDLYLSTFDPEADPDQDGWTNAVEAAAGTDPQNPNPPDGLVQPEVLHTPAVMGEENGQPVIITPAAVTLTWPTIPGKRYTLFYSPDLESSGWLPVEDPFIGQGTEVTYGFAFSDPETDPTALFWRIAVTDTDTDGDTLADAEEHQLGTNRLLVDSDADGMADNVDPHPNSALTTFPDDDGDGIANADDSEPNTSAGFPPVITSDTTTLSRIVNVVAGESVNFLVRVNNPSGPAVSASDLKLFVSGTEQSAEFAAAGDNKFSVNWTAQIHTNYPATILQNITVRFRDSRSATAWLELARLDVAQWQGMLAGAASRASGQQDRTFLIGGHADGVPLPPSDWAGASGNSARWYRGPLAVRYFGRAVGQLPPGADLGTLSLTANMRYPFVIIDDSASPAAPQTDVRDISDPSQYQHGVWGLNHWDSEIQVKSANHTATFPESANTFRALPQPVDGDAPYHFEAQYYADGEWRNSFNNVWLIPARTTMRYMHGLIGQESSTNSQEASIQTWHMHPAIEARMVGSAAGTLDHPGLSFDHPQHTQPLYMAPIQWHRIVIKVGPDVAVVARGVRLRLNSGAEGTGAAQTGIELKLKTATGFEPYTPGEILEGPGLYSTLTGPTGLVLFARLAPGITRMHRLTLDLLPNGAQLEPLELTKLELIPVDVDDNEPATGVDDVSLTSNDPHGRGYQNRFWIMAPTGSAPDNLRCSNDTVIKVSREPDTNLRVNCAYSNCDYRHPVTDETDSPPVPVGYGTASAVRWLGRGVLSGDHTPLYYFENALKSETIPISIKVMKRRTVNVALYPVRCKPGNRAVPVPDKVALENWLNKVFAYQVNAWFQVEYKEPTDYDYDPDGDEITTLFTNLGAMIGRPEFQPNAVDIRVFVTDSVSLTEADPTGDDLNGITSAIQSAIVVNAGNPDAPVRPPQQVIETIAHEIGHLLVGPGHAELEEGRAPLPGTERNQRLMSSFGYRLPGARLLVKAEWDEAEKWLKNRPRGDN